MKIYNLLLGTAALCACSVLNAQTPTLTVQTSKPGTSISPTMYGVFFEDINYAADGGLYAEMVKNRSFEFTPDHFMGWQMFGHVTLKDDGPFERNPHYVELTSPGHSEKWTGLQNEGFFGMGVRQGESYRFSVWARVPDGTPVTLMVQLIDESSMSEEQNFTSADLTIDSKTWKKYTLILKSARTTDKANLRIFLSDAKHNSGTGTVDLEHVSLFPVNTFKGRENGLRADLAQALADMHPGIFRFPGGCIVEGCDLGTRYQWKNTVGPVENRPLNENRWEYTFNYRFFPDYRQSYGLGFYEFFQLCEDIGAAPLPVLNVGMACQFQNWDNEKAHVPANADSLKPYIQDVLDLIEFANGPATSQWGKVRADMGHPAPFNLKYIAIGNEQWESFYYERLKPFVAAVRKAYPDIKIIGTSGPDSEGKSFEDGWKAMRAQKADLVDEHFYRNIDWFKNNMDRYANYDRRGPKVFAGEYACHDKGKKWNHFGASIYEAAFMTTLERNADVVRMATYAPLFAHIAGWQWRPDLIWYDNLRTFRSCSYYVQQMYATNKGTNVLPATLSSPTPKGQDGLFASAVWDKPSQSVIVKVINTTTAPQPLDIVLKGLKTTATTAETVSLGSTNPLAENTLDNPNTVVPVDGSATINVNTIKATIPPTTFVVYKVKKQ
jgi:alpha-L-arabinofuranosidase